MAVLKTQKNCYCMGRVIASLTMFHCCYQRVALISLLYGDPKVVALLTLLH